MIPFKISTLLFIEDDAERLLLIQRQKAPNRGLWSPPGGKLDMASGESPHRCAAREAREETGLALTPDDLHLFATVAERAYEGSNHWLMFLFAVRPRLTQLPPAIQEGHFGWFSKEEIETLAIPETDRDLIWPPYHQNRSGFTALFADFTGNKPEIEIEESF